MMVGCFPAAPFVELDDCPLLVVDPARQNHEHKVPWLQYETHESPRLKSNGENDRIKWPSVAVNGPTRGSAASAQLHFGGYLRLG